MAAPASRRALIAVAQMTSTADTAANFDVCASLARRAASAGACMLFLPECCHFMGSGAGEGAKVAEPLTGPTMTRYRDLARSHGLALSVGGFPERGDPTPSDSAAHAVYNTHVVISSSGDVLASYRKVHLFDLSLGAVSLKESEHTTPGSRLVLADTPAGPMGLSICYDLRFPAMYAALRQAGASIIAVPSAFTVPTGSAHWEVLLRARAVETQCYVVAAAQVGKHNDKRASYGHAMVVDPWGTVIAQCGDNVSPGLALAEVDGAYVADVRSRMPVVDHARPDVYASRVAISGRTEV